MKGSTPRGFLVLTALLVLGFPAFAQDAAVVSLWDQAVEAIRFNRMSEAVPLLEAVVSSEPNRIDARRYLAVAYEQTDRVEEALEVLSEGIEIEAIAAPQRGRLAFDLAALLGRREDVAGAIARYEEALRLDPGLASAYLNRGNIRVAAGEYAEAVADYQRYLALRPTSSQRPEIERMIGLLTETIAAREEERRQEEERRRAEEEAARVAEEEARRREEIARQEEAARRQAMLDAVLESLSEAGSEAESFEIENEDIESYEEEIDILD